MSQMGLLFVISQPSAAMEDELNEWYDQEHIPERLAIKGFISALRYVSAARPRRYLALYDLTDVDVLQSENYKAFAGENFTPWTKRVVSRAKFTRAEAVQSFPGNAATTIAPGLLVARFSGIEEHGAALIQEGAERCFSNTAQVSQVRVFAGHGEALATHFVIVAGTGALDALLDSAAFGQAARHLDLVESFLPY